ncbi:MAG: ABC transporter substrate-binding protein [Actinomycetota bacterium]|nr:ABC transporter substrate-binding protein [Actinomycetota bacterium]
MTRPTRAWRAAAVGATALLMLTACGGNTTDTGAGPGATPTETETTPTEEETSPSPDDSPTEDGGGADQQCPLPEPAKGNGKLVLGSLLPLTGDLAFLGPPEVAGVELAVQDINEAGGVLGNDVRLAQADSGDGSPDIAPSETDKLLNAGVDAIIGAASSSVSLSVIDKITSAGVVQMSPANTSTAFDNCDDNGFYFRTAPSDVLQGAVLANLIANDGHDNIAILARQEAYGEALANQVDKVFTESGGTVVEKVFYTPEATNWTSEVQRIAASDPEAIVLIAFNETTSIVPEMVSNDIGPNNKQVYFVDGNTADYSKEFQKGTLDGVRATYPGAELTSDFRQRLLEVDPKLDSFTYGPESYDAAMLIALAAVAANDDSGASIARNLEAVSDEGTECTTFEECRSMLENGDDIDYQGVSGPINFNGTGSPSAATIGIFEYQPNNNFTNVEYVTGDIS